MNRASSLFAALIAALVVSGCSGDCAGPYKITTSREFDSIGHCESIDEGLWFDGQAWLSGIDLPLLSEVRGDMYVGANGALTSLDGLSSLKTVGGFLDIWDNDALRSLGGLSSLEFVGEDLSIHGNACLSQAQAGPFAAGLDVGGDVELVGNGDDYPCD